MARKYCLLPTGFSEDVALDCSKHGHLNLREVREQETAGEIFQFDLHPVNNRPRYIIKTHNWSPTAIPAGLALRAAGANFPEASDEERRARRKVTAYDHVEEHEWAKTYHWAVLNDVTYDEEDVWFGSGHLEGRRPVRVALVPRTPEAVQAAAGFYLKRYRQAGAVAPEQKLHGHSERAQSIVGSGTFDQFLSAIVEMPALLKNLDGAWRQIVTQFSAGRWTATLNEMRPGKLPSEILRQVLQAYLHEH